MSLFGDKSIKVLHVVGTWASLHTEGVQIECPYNQVEWPILHGPNSCIVTDVPMEKIQGKKKKPSNILSPSFANSDQLS